MRRALIRETLARGGKACRPLLARDGIGNVFVEPALRYLQQRGVSIALQDELVALHFSGGRVDAARIRRRGPCTLGGDDAVILAVPPYVAAAKRCPICRRRRRSAASSTRISASIRPRDMPPMLGVINGTCEWIFALPGRMSVTISDAGRLFDMPREELARDDLARGRRASAGLPDTLPPWQIVRERRATFAATPEQNALRPGARNGMETICSSPATGPRPGCRPRSKAPSAPAIAPPTSPMQAFAGGRMTSP